MSNIYNSNPDFWKRSTPQIQSDFLCRPHMIKLAGDLDGKIVADLGCGEGYLSRLLLKKNPEITSIHAIDNSERMLSYFEESSVIKKDLASVVDLENLIENHSISTVFSSLVYVHLLREEMVKANREVLSILEPGGTFILGVPHPMIYCSNLETKWIKYPVIKDYTRTEVEISLSTLSGEVFGPFAQKIHSVSDYINAGLEAGLTLSRIEEPLASQEDIESALHMWGLEDKNSCISYLGF